MTNNAPCPNPRRSGFTLIELSIVLVIIALLIGGTMVGQDMIHAAAIRSQIGQIEKYNAAVHAFQTKYNNELPGDMPATDAAALGFATRTGLQGHGDGNGIIEVPPWNAEPEGENALFWNDLSTANLINGQYLGSDCIDGTCNANAALVLNQLIPDAKLGNGNSLIVYGDSSGNYYQIIGGGIVVKRDGIVINGSANNPPAGMTPLESFQIDSKIDDGYPTTGQVTWISGILASHNTLPTAGIGAAANAGQCGNTNTTPTSYNTSGSYATSVICSIRIRFQ